MTIFLLIAAWWLIGSLSFYLLHKSMWSIPMDLFFIYICGIAGMFGLFNTAILLFHYYMKSKNVH